MRLFGTVRLLLVLLALLATGGVAAPAGAATTTAHGEDAALQRIRAETERARAEADRARAETERARAEADRLREAAPDVSVSATTPDPGAYRRDGFFLRMAVGGGYAGYRSSGKLTGVDAATPNLSQDDAGGDCLLSIGGIVAPDLALHADFWGGGGPALDLEKTRVDVSNGTIGLGLTRYWMPWNVYVSGAVGLSITTWHTPDDGAFVEEDAIAGGVGTYLMLGKEWWVSENWSLGIALRGSYAWTTNDDVTFHHTTAHALFTATFN